MNNGLRKFPENRFFACLQISGSGLEWSWELTLALNAVEQMTSNESRENNLKTIFCHERNSSENKNCSYIYTYIAEIESGIQRQTSMN